MNVLSDIIRQQIYPPESKKIFLSEGFYTDMQTFPYS